MTPPDEPTPETRLANSPPGPYAVKCGAAGAAALALIGGLGILALGTLRGGLEKDLSTTITMAVVFACAGAAAGWFAGRGASKLIVAGDTWGTGAAKVGSRAAGMGAVIGSLGGLQFGALGSVAGVFLGGAAFGAVGAGLGLLFVALNRAAP